MTKPLSIVLAASLLGGCVDNKNLRLTIGDDIPLDSFPPEVIEPATDSEGATSLATRPADDAPTAMDLGRANFEPLVYRVPIDGTRHEFHGVGEISLTDETARQRGEFPTAATSLETGGWASTREQTLEVIGQPVFAAGGLIIHGVGLLYPEWLAANFVSGLRSSPAAHERSPVSADPSRIGVIHEDRLNEAELEQPVEAEPEAPGSVESSEG